MQSERIMDRNIHELRQQARVGLDTQELILKDVLGKQDWSKADPIVYRAYFSYYRRQFDDAGSGEWMRNAVRSKQDIIDVVSRIRTSQIKDDIIDALHEKRFPGVLRNKFVGIADENAAVWTRTIELAARVLTMHEIGYWGNASQYSLPWNVTISLQQCLKDHYHPPQMSDKIKLEKRFDIRALSRIAGFTIIWTDNLAEHLSLRDHGDTRTVRIFHHAAYLNLIRSNQPQNVFPPNFIPETLNTLKLLFPHRSTKIRLWMQKQASKEEFSLDWSVLECERLLDEERQIDKFYFWRDRLIILKQAYDESQPRTLMQWWNDRRNQVQWATFWTAVWVLLLTIFFGLIQSIEGAIQVYKAYHPSS